MNDTLIASLFSFLISDGFFLDFGTNFSRRPLISRKRKQSRVNRKTKMNKQRNLSSYVTLLHVKTDLALATYQPHI